MKKNLFLGLLLVCSGASFAGEYAVVEESGERAQIFEVSQEPNTLATKIKGLAREFYKSDIGNGISVGVMRAAVIGLINVGLNVVFDTSKFNVDAVQDPVVRKTFLDLFTKKQNIFFVWQVIAFFAMNKVRTQTNDSWLAMFIDYFMAFSLKDFVPGFGGEELHNILAKPYSD